MEKGAGALPLADSVCAAASVTMECLYTLGPFSPRQEEENGMPGDGVHITVKLASSGFGAT